MLKKQKGGREGEEGRVDILPRFTYAVPGCKCAHKLLLGLTLVIASSNLLFVLPGAPRSPIVF